MALTSSAAIDQELRLRIADQLGAGFKGNIIGPDHAGYGEARTVWNAMVDKRPGAILRCTSTADVVAAVNVARANGLPPSIRCGGHSVSGKALSDGGLTIDMGGIREVTVDAEHRLVHAGGGCLLGDIDQATAPHGLIVPAGIMSETGVAGLALGGGIGWFSRKHGLTCDQFVSSSSCWPAGRSSTSPPPSTPSCSGPSRVAAATSGWSRGSPSGLASSAR